MAGIPVGLSIIGAPIKAALHSNRLSIAYYDRIIKVMTDTTASGLNSAKGFRTQDPRTNEVIEVFDYLTDDQMTTAVSAADEASIPWKMRSIEDRARVAYRVADLLDEQRYELAQIAALEIGKALDQVDAELQECIDIFRYYADNGPCLAADEVLSDDSNRRAVLQRRPLGVLLGIMPWNYPYYQVVRFVAPNLVLGNSIVLKHAETCPRSALALERLFLEGGVPEGVYQNLFATHNQIEKIIADDRIHGVSITGSERAGGAVAATAGTHLKKVVLELGGSDAHIYFSTVDTRTAARQAVDLRLENMGQACTSNKRLLVHGDLYAEFVAEVVDYVSSFVQGDPFEPYVGTYYPMSSEAAADNFVEQLQRAVDQGATLHVGGERLNSPGAWVRPAVITNITEDMDAYHEEFFGPVVAIYKVNDELDAVNLANDSPFGLAGSVFSQDERQALRVAQQLDVGMSHVNIGGSEAADMPFGGVKRSGFGRELGPLGMDEFVNKRLLYISK